MLLLWVHGVCVDAIQSNVFPFAEVAGLVSCSAVASPDAAREGISSIGSCICRRQIGADMTRALRRGEASIVWLWTLRGARHQLKCSERCQSCSAQERTLCRPFLCKGTAFCTFIVLSNSFMMSRGTSTPAYYVRTADFQAFDTLHEVQ